MSARQKPLALTHRLTMKHIKLLFFLILRSELVPAFMPTTGNIATETCLASRPGQSGGTGSRAVALRQTPGTGISRPNHGKTTA